MDYDEDDYEMMPHDRLLALADGDRLAAESFYCRYRNDDDPVLQAEARKVLKSLAEDFEARSFWADWYNELLFSNDPEEVAVAEEWRQKIIHEGVYGMEDLIALRIIEENDEYVDRLAGSLPPSASDAAKKDDRLQQGAMRHEND